MREGSDQIALLHGEGFCKPKEYDLRYNHGSPWVDAIVNVGQNYSHCVLSTWSNEESQRNCVFQNKVYTLVSRQLQRRSDYTILQLLRGNARPLR